MGLPERGHPAPHEFVMHPLQTLLPTVPSLQIDALGWQFGRKWPAVPSGLVLRLRVYACVWGRRVTVDICTQRNPWRRKRRGSLELVGGHSEEPY